MRLSAKSLTPPRHPRDKMGRYSLSVATLISIYAKVLLQMIFSVRLKFDAAHPNFIRNVPIQMFSNIVSIIATIRTKGQRRTKSHK